MKTNGSLYRGLMEGNALLSCAIKGLRCASLHAERTLDYINGRLKPESAADYTAIQNYHTWETSDAGDEPPLYLAYVDVTETLLQFAQALREKGEAMRKAVTEIERQRLQSKLVHYDEERMLCERHLAELQKAEEAKPE